MDGQVSAVPDIASLFRERVRGFARFAEWERTHPREMTAAAAVASIGAIYQLLPKSSRSRPIDTSGVARMQAALRHLK